jgi:hypothetical protein
MTTTIGYTDTVLSNAKCAGSGASTATAQTGTQKMPYAQLAETINYDTISSGTHRRKRCQYTLILHTAYLHMK